MSNCPSCGAPVPVLGPGLAYATCRYCQTLLVRHGEALEAVGTVATLPADVSPVQIGTTFTVEGTAWRTVGRVRWGWQGGSWNEWLLQGPYAETRWLAEAMGMYLFSAAWAQGLAEPAIAAFARGEALRPGAHVQHEATIFIATDVKEATCLGSEGDLPFATLPGRTMRNVDFRSSTGAALSVQRDAEGTMAWLGQWHDLAGLAPQGLRAIPGWTRPGGLA